MNAKEGIEQIIQPALNQILGTTAANLIISRAFIKLVTVKGDEKTKFQAAVDLVCQDALIKKAIGEARSNQFKQNWNSKF